MDDPLSRIALQDMVLHEEERDRSSVQHAAVFASSATLLSLNVLVRDPADG